MVYTNTTGSATAVWNEWIDMGTTGTTTQVWSAWTDSTATITTTGYDTTWDLWVTDNTITRVECRSIESAEQIAARENERKERIELERARKARARRLLVSALNAKQRLDLDKHNYFYVVGGKSGNKYRIDHGRAGNVKLMVNGQVRQSFCIHPSISCPNEDTMLAQMVMLEHMEDQFKDTANITYH
jgi:hypothetical protein